MFSGNEEKVSDQKQMRRDVMNTLETYKAQGIEVNYDALLQNIIDKYGIESGEFAEMYELLKEFNKRQ